MSALPSSAIAVRSLLSINNYHYRRGGAEAVFLDQNALFEQRGWKVMPFAMRHERNLDTPWSHYFVDEIEFGGQYSAGRQLVNAAKIIWSTEARRRIESLVREHRPSIAHAHNVYHHISPAIFGKLHSLGVPVVLTLHDLKIACPAYKMLTHDGVCERCRGGALWNVAVHRCMKDSLALSALILLESTAHRVLGCYRNHVTRFVVPSRFYLEKFVEWGWPRERFMHVPNFVDTSALEPGRDTGESFVYFGRLAPEKGLGTLIRAAATARVRIRVVGTGPDETELRKLAQAQGADIEFLGYRSGSELHAIVRGARAVVLPSEWYENAPMTVLEAYALGRAVIGANIGGIPELVRPGETGSVFPSGDVDALAAELDAMRRRPDSQVLDMGRAGRDWVLRDFTPAAYADRLLGVYRELGVAA
ncbi:MAG: glycosyltransferase family 4 protein [Rubrivivax sp.]|nr:glycosyltransferase family 4 protein [Rubrivivax sp.]